MNEEVFKSQIKEMKLNNINLNHFLIILIIKTLTLLKRVFCQFMNQMKKF